MTRKGIKKVIISVFIGALLSINVVNAANCDAIFTPEAYEFIRELLGYATIIIPVLLILLCATDLVAVVMASDDSVAKKVGGKIAKRCIAAVAFFFVPLIVRFFLGLEEVKTTLNLVDDPLCGITAPSNTPQNPGP